MLIDTHHHFWRYTTEEFGWIPDSMANIRRDFLPADLERLIALHHIDGVVTVQARQSLAETKWLLQLADQHSFVHGVVGWLDLKADNILEQISEYSAGALVGVRHVLQGEADAFMDDPAFNRGLRAVMDANLVYDLLILDRQLPAAIALVDRHPNLRFILDHFGKPRIDIDQLEPWKTHLTELAKRRNVYCKISGGITEAALDWTPARLEPYLDAAIDAFGAHRLVFGSNWPVCDAAGGYDAWLNAIQAWASALTPTERESLFSENATALYAL
jgi:L-fuconolactonase